MSGLAKTPDAPIWHQYTVESTDLDAAATTNDIELFSLDAGGIIHAVKIKHSVAFTGGIISAYTVSVGITGTLAKYHTAFNVFQAPGNTVQSIETNTETENHATSVSIRIAAISTGANLNAATGGTVDVWVLISQAT